MSDLPPAATPPVEPPLPNPGRGSVGLAVAILVVGTAVAAAAVLAIVVAAWMGIRTLSHRPHAVAVATPHAVPLPVAPPDPSPPVVPPPAVPLPAVPAPATQPAAEPAGPWLGSMSPTTGRVGETVVLRGRNLSGVDDIVLFPQHGGASVEAATFDVSDDRITFPIPAVDKAEGAEAGDGYYVAVFAKSGACLMVDDTFHTTPWGVGGSLSHDAIRVRRDDPFVGSDHLLVFGEPGATVTVGNDSIVLLGRGCTLAGYGSGCKVFYEPPLSTPDAPVEGMVSLPSVRVNRRGQRLMLTPLPPLGEPGDGGN